MRLFWICLAVTLLVVASSPVLANEYNANRFDSRIEVLPAGSLKVVETIVFSFTKGTFKQVFRTIPTRSTDGVEFVSASMDGQALSQGEGPGHVRVQRQNGLRIEWNFAPVAASTHTFELTYIASGVVRQGEDADLLEWRALPREHDYRIDASSIEILVPEAPVRAPHLETRRVDGRSDVVVRAGAVVVHTAQIRRNGSVIVSIPFPRGSVLDGPPRWQARQRDHLSRMPAWLATSAALTLAGFVLLFGMRQNYDAPPPDTGLRWNSMIPPDSTAPAIAGALAANGQPQLEHAMAALFALAERGVISIREEHRGRLSQRHFTIERTSRASPLSPHEEAALDISFAGNAGTGATIPLSKARAYLTRHWSRFKAAVMRELTEAQMMSEHRRASRSRFMKTGVILLLLAAVAVIPCAFLVEGYGGWPFFIPLAIAVVSMTSFIVMGSLTPLSNEGVRHAEQWRAFKNHLADPQGVEPRWGAAGTAETRILPLAVTFGLAAVWSKFMDKRHAPTPRWFQAASSLESAGAFSAFVAAGGAGAHGTSAAGHAGHAGVAGGGASGAR